MASLPPFIPRAPEIVDAPERQLRDAIAGAGLPPPDTILMDGRVHRFPTNGKRKDDSGCILHFRMVSLPGALAVTAPAWTCHGAPIWGGRYPLPNRQR